MDEEKRTDVEVIKKESVKSSNSSAIPTTEEETGIISDKSVLGTGSSAIPQR